METLERFQHTGDGARLFAFDVDLDEIDGGDIEETLLIEVVEAGDAYGDLARIAIRAAFDLGHKGMRGAVRYGVEGHGAFAVGERRVDGARPPEPIALHAAGER